MKNLLIFFGIIILLFVSGKILLNIVNSESAQKPIALTPPTSYEYYYAKIDCPGCIKVTEFMELWDKKENIQVAKFDIGESQENVQKLIQRGSMCGIPTEEIEMPFLVTPEGVCISRDEPIIEYLNKLEP
ncbi:hypothetical protein A2955_03575 [Candidatus Woesebacteria bacterium RIFCSPLOWO2_01_FULL_37_19]|uniref:Glutaredoxin domain-containing protein n=2 Tax=Candidatus Woeseibacteriota TaxID=1752722 RepID=A0A1F8B8R3_9BACT|nr:MAG: hypothetical protein A2771_02570 [Candidatus Woesebacteria bacterium RIFCSPHIGHO2_01_FULL_38_26b]OGM59805.1 MAG: hypothetical protein A2955_03575 [Candidatus Woesebacteria bacterium RIFCSPLOWO2_01_FULL_37_19]